MALKDLLKEQRSCPRCNICKWIPIEKYARRETQAGCPAIEQYQFHAYSAGGKQHMCIGINEDRIPLDESVADVAYKCHFCGACEYACKVYRPDMDVTETFDELRMACVEKGVYPDAHRAMMTSLSEHDNCKGYTTKIDWTENTGIKILSGGQTGEIFLYAGDSALYCEATAARTAKIAKLLLSKGLDLITAGSEESNGGYEAFVLGHLELGKTCAQRVKAQVEASGAKTIIVMDAHSFGTMRNYYPRHGIDLGVEVKHITELIAELISNGQIEFSGSCKKVVTYHDPCYLGRRSDPYKPPFPGPKDTRPVCMSRTGQLGIYDAPRAILAAIPGVTLKEMDRIKGYAWCCGGGAGVPEAYPELMKSTSDTRMSEAKDTGAEFLVTACATCEGILSNTDDGIKVVDILDLLLNEGGAH